MGDTPRHEPAATGPLTEVHVSPLPPERFREVVGERWPEVREAIDVARGLFAGRVIWHVNSTARGGGVAELLQSLIAYARGAGVDNRWIVIEGDPEFFAVTKRIHNFLHGSKGDGGELGPSQREIYEAVTNRSAEALARRVRPGDIVFLHDPQTAGMTKTLRETGAHVVWRCHVGVDTPNELAKRGWDFVRPYAQEADSYVFSRREFAWERLHDRKVWIVAPSIDAFSPKNQELEPATVDAILATAGLWDRHGESPALFTRVDGSPGRVDSVAEVDEDAPIPADVPVLTQVSRWDRLKDPAGVLRCFAEHCGVPELHLLLGGPATEAVSDDPEGADVLEEVRELRAGLGPAVRARVHLACLPMHDIEENAAIVNAVQRRSTVVMQKSIAEGFGLTVAEAMWKRRPVVATRCGGIQDQINGESGILVDDPHDLAGFGAAVEGLVADPTHAEAIGGTARERVREHFLGTRHLIQYMRLLAELIDGPPGSRMVM